MHGQIVENTQLKSQNYLNSIRDWTKNQKMLLNKNKTKAMIVNFTEKHQFSTRLQLYNRNIQVVDNMKILGTTFSNKLDWTLNCKEIITKVNKQIVFLMKIACFSANQQEMVHLWTIYCRSALEQSAVLWQGSLTK